MKPITEQRRQELIEYIKAALAAHVQRGGDSDEEDVFKIALASLTAVRHQWSNGCNLWVPRALRYLAENERPGGGNSYFNTEHLYQLARELELSMSSPLYTAPPVPVIKLPEKLPCDVRFDPGMIFRKGVLVQTMLDALIRRDDYEKELAELSEDERKARQEKISEFLNGLGE
ncbi:hypothetical protein GCM10009414_21160 [Tatumella terrea]|uniref:hypothetical protein n=1 Tax=Tatumella terrea TaxID=419007 RepID=UPI0031CEA915